jgi:hypothetical protein
LQHIRVSNLDASIIQAGGPDRENLSRSLLESIEHVKSDRTEQYILFEILLKFGLELIVPIEQRSIADKTVHSIGARSQFVCLAPKIGRQDKPHSHPRAASASECQKSVGTIFRQPSTLRRRQSRRGGNL